MHDYSLDGHPKEKILFFLAFIVISVTPWLNGWFNSFGIHFGMWDAPIKAIPVAGLFGAIYLLFEKVLWKVPVFRKFFLVPDLNGAWECSGETTLKNGAPADTKWKATIHIKQSWSKIIIHLKTENSGSVSVSASIYNNKDIGYKLLYQYKNEVKAMAHDYDMKNHAGSVELQFSEDCKTAEGNYYTDQHRNTVGNMNLRRKK